jgi:hypothetical protein
VTFSRLSECPLSHHRPYESFLAHLETLDPANDFLANTDDLKALESGHLSAGKTGTLEVVTLKGE